jgi:hypothetical protein
MKPTIIRHKTVKDGFMIVVTTFEKMSPVMVQTYSTGPGYGENRVVLERESVFESEKAGIAYFNALTAY